MMTSAANMMPSPAPATAPCTAAAIRTIWQCFKGLDAGIGGACKLANEGTRIVSRSDGSDIATATETLPRTGHQYYPYIVAVCSSDSCFVQSVGQGHIDGVSSLRSIEFDMTDTVSNAEINGL